MRSCKCAMAAKAGTAFWRGMKYSLCNSSPLLGVKFMRKWGNRSCQGPGMPRWGCSARRRGWRSDGDRRGRGWHRKMSVRASVRIAFVDSVFEPDLVDALLLPVGEQAHAVSAFGDGVEVVFQLMPWEIFVDILLHLKRPHNFQGKAGDDSQGTEGDDHSVKLLGMLFSGEFEEPGHRRSPFPSL